MSFKINEEEWKRLMWEPPHIFKMYCGIRRKMDYDTGIAGGTDKKNYINEEYLKELLGIEPRSGSHRERYRATRGIIYSSLRQLEELGLIEKKKGLIFKCVLADLRPIRSNEDETRMKQGCNIGRNIKKYNNSLINNEIIKEDETEDEQTTRGGCNNLRMSGIDMNNPNGLSISTPISPFEKFWSLYPRKVNKKKAAELWRTRKLDAMAAQIIADVEQRKARHTDWMKEEGRFIPHPTTYLNGERWMDEIVTYAEGIKNETIQRSPKIGQSKSKLARLYESCESAFDGTPYSRENYPEDY